MNFATKLARVKILHNLTKENDKREFSDKRCQRIIAKRDEKSETLNSDKMSNQAHLDLDHACHHLRRRKTKLGHNIFTKFLHDRSEFHHFHHHLLLRVRHRFAFRHELFERGKFWKLISATI